MTKNELAAKVAEAAWLPCKTLKEKVKKGGECAGNRRHS